MTVNADTVDKITGANVVFSKVDASKAARVGDVDARGKVVVVVASDVTVESIEPKVRVSNKNAIPNYGFH